MKQRKPGEVSLERAISKLGIASRSQAREWIESKRISVNGVIQTHPQFSVVPERIQLALDGKPWRTPSKRTFLLYKPKGVVTTRVDEKGRPTVFSLLKGKDLYLHAVGRLDLATSGLLILTNDTKLSSYLTNPQNRVVRSYVVTVRGAVTENELQKLERQAHKVILRKTSNKESHLLVELTEGKNREIRKMFLDLEHEVTRLKRTAYGLLTLGSLKPGEYRELTVDEIENAFPILSIHTFGGKKHPKK